VCCEGKRGREREEKELKASKKSDGSICFLKGCIFHFQKVPFKEASKQLTEHNHLCASTGRTGIKIKSAEMNESPRSKAISRCPSG